MYYLRSRPAVNPIKFTVDIEALLKDSCEGFEVKQFNPQEKKEVLIKEEAEEAKENVVPGILSSIENQAKAGEEPGKAGEPKACPFRRKRKPVVEGEVQEEDEECLACGS
jgi:hypothetical protein